MLTSMLNTLKTKVCERGQKCSCFIDKFLKWDWSVCCGMHDKRYANKRLTRKQADILLRRCVMRKTNCVILAYGMYLGVRTLGWYWYEKAQRGSTYV